MARIIFLLVIFALIVVLVIYIVKAIRLNNSKDKTPIQKTKERSNYSVADELLKLQNLREEGIITEKEFEEMKKKLME